MVTLETAPRSRLGDWLRLDRGDDEVDDRAGKSQGLGHHSGEAPANEPQRRRQRPPQLVEEADFPEQPPAGPCDAAGCVGELDWRPQGGLRSAEGSEAPGGLSLKPLLVPQCGEGPRCS